MCECVVRGMADGTDGCGFRSTKVVGCRAEVREGKGRGDYVMLWGGGGLVIGFLGFGIWDLGGKVFWEVGGGVGGGFSAGDWDGGGGVLYISEFG